MTLNCQKLPVTLASFAAVPALELVPVLWGSLFPGGAQPWLGEGADCQQTEGSVQGLGEVARGHGRNPHCDAKASRLALPRMVLPASPTKSRFFPDLKFWRNPGRQNPCPCSYYNSDIRPLKINQWSNSVTLGLQWAEGTEESWGSGDIGGHVFLAQMSISLLNNIRKQKWLKKDNSFTGYQEKATNKSYILFIQLWDCK